MRRKPLIRNPQEVRDHVRVLVENAFEAWAKGLVKDLVGSSVLLVQGVSDYQGQLQKLKHRTSEQEELLADLFVLFQSYIVPLRDKHFVKLGTIDTRRLLRGEVEVSYRRDLDCLFRDMVSCVRAWS